MAAQGSTESVRCPKCAKSLSSKWAVTRHYNISHLNQWPYKCDVCSKRFTGKRDTLNHMKRIHNASAQQLSKVKIIKYAPLDHLDFVNGWKKAQQEPISQGSSSLVQCTKSSFPRGEQATLSKPLPPSIQRLSCMPMKLRSHAQAEKKNAAIKGAANKPQKNQSKNIARPRPVTANRAPTKALPKKATTVKCEPKADQGPQSRRGKKRSLVSATERQSKPVQPVAPRRAQLGTHAASKGGKYKPSKKAKKAQEVFDKPALKATPKVPVKVVRIHSKSGDSKRKQKPAAATVLIAPRQRQQQLPYGLKHKCAMCPHSFKFKKELVAHKNEEHAAIFTKKMACAECGETFAERSDLRAHKYEFHGYMSGKASYLAAQAAEANLDQGHKQGQAHSVKEPEQSKEVTGKELVKRKQSKIKGGPPSTEKKTLVTNSALVANAETQSSDSKCDPEEEDFEALIPVVVVANAHSRQR